MQYYALYRTKFGWETGEQPTGIVVDQAKSAPDWTSMVYHAMHWSHYQKAWMYDPRGNADMLSDEDYEDRWRVVSREEAEQITPAITGGEELPDEETIKWIFQWKGEPPQAEDTPDRWP